MWSMRCPSYRVVSNLLTNAVRHGAPPFVMSAARTNRELSITIEDRGAGSLKSSSAAFSSDLHEA
jgi:signal transduction histidine kinase